MKINYFYPRWGSENIKWTIFLDHVKALGFDGVEIGLPNTKKEIEFVLEEIDKRALHFILQHHETTTPDFKLHREQLNERLNTLSNYKPYLINSHTGRDHFSFEENMSLINDSLTIEKQSNICILHETHRSRFSFAPQITSNYLTEENIKLTLDISHWFCVTESLLNDFEKHIDKAVLHTKHIHARFGHQQGPQIENIHDPRNTEIINRHFQIWDDVIYHQKLINATDFAVTTEFGPWPYLRANNLSAGCNELKQNALNEQILKLFKNRYK